MRSEIEFKLSQKLEYHESGNAQATTDVVFIEAPTALTKYKAIEFRQRMMWAFKSANSARQDGQEAPDEIDNVGDKMTSDQIIIILNFATEEYVEVWKKFEELIPRIVYIRTSDDRKIYLTKKLMEDIYSHRNQDDLGGDIEEMLGLYCENFIMPSLTKRLKRSLKG